MSKKSLAAIAFLAMVILTLSCEVLAEETEELQLERNVTFMFVQNAQSGTLVPMEGEDNLYTLTLMGVAPQTIAFSDRPERVVVQAPMQQFLDGIFSCNNPPNAALEILESDEDEDLAVVELLDPVYDADNQTLQYNVSILEMPDLSYAVFNERADQALPETFGPAALFIDDCSDSFICCFTGNSECCGCIDIGCCFKLSHFGCTNCYDDSHYTNACIKKYGSNCDVVHDGC